MKVGLLENDDDGVPPHAGRQAKIDTKREKEENCRFCLQEDDDVPPSSLAGRQEEAQQN